MTTIETLHPIDGLPRPLDPLIRGGIELTPYNDTEEIQLVIERLLYGFDELRKDTSKEYGTCLAYGTDIPVSEINTIDASILRVSKEINHGRVSNVRPSSEVESSELCRGYLSESNKMFILGKRIGEIVFDNASIESGFVYTLHGRTRLK